jgi:hypothetical protein
LDYCKALFPAYTYFSPPVLSSPVAIPVAILERPNAMPRDGAIIFSDLIGKLDVLYAAN